jgi:hypothetical protein
MRACARERHASSIVTTSRPERIEMPARSDTQGYGAGSTPDSVTSSELTTSLSTCIRKRRFFAEQCFIVVADHPALEHTGAYGGGAASEFGEIFGESGFLPFVLKRPRRRR